jgi:hypothetical protein
MSIIVQCLWRFHFGNVEPIQVADLIAANCDPSSFLVQFKFPNATTAASRSPRHLAAQRLDEATRQVIWSCLPLTHYRFSFVQYSSHHQALATQRIGVQR